MISEKATRSFSNWDSNEIRAHYHLRDFNYRMRFIDFYDNHRMSAYTRLCNQVVESELIRELHT